MQPIFPSFFHPIFAQEWNKKRFSLIVSVGTQRLIGHTHNQNPIVNVMNKSKLRYILPVIIGLLAIPFHTALAQFTLSAQLRPRPEYRSGYRLLKSDGENPAFFISQRTRINADYRTPLYRVYLSLQDVRVWGDQPQLTPDAGLGLHEAWAQIKLGTNYNVRFGRQELVYDDQRLLGAVNWSQTARSHDAMVFHYYNPDQKFRVHVGGAYNQDSEQVLNNYYTVSNNYKALGYVWAHKKWEHLGLSGLLLSDGFQVPGSTRFRYTYGIDANYSNHPATFHTAFYIQNGDDANRTNIAAYMFTASASFSMNPWKLTAGYDHLSGGENSDAEPARHAFNTLYATNHKFYGHMDYFVNIPQDTYNRGLQDFYLLSQYELNKKTALHADFHYFSLLNQTPLLIGAPSNTEKDLGAEIDASVAYQISEELSVQAGLSGFFNSDKLEEIQGRNSDGFEHWGWVMLNLKPTFLTSK